MRSNRRLMLLIAGMITAAVVLAWHFIWVQPKKDCVKQGGAWDEHSRSCARSVTITP